MVCRGAIRTADSPVAQWSRTSSPTCRRLAPDFALFPFGYQDSVHLAGVPYPKSAKSAAADYRPSRRHVGGRVQKSPIGHTNADDFAQLCDWTTVFCRDEFLRL